ncbi:MAG: MaoC/PaaZ C-terminal domain-containing protein [Devosia sp.]
MIASTGLDFLQTLRVEREQAYDERDTILYALGVGMGAGVGAGNGDERELNYLHEVNLQALPSYATTLAFTDMTPYYVHAGLTAGRLLHAQQMLQIHSPLPARGRVTSTTTGLGFQDKGAEHGLIFYYQTELKDEGGRQLATLAASTFCLDDGGKAEGRDSFKSPFPDSPTPDGAPQGMVDLPTVSQQALIYRLSGDLNAVHVLPARARQLGLARPPLHGRCTLGIATQGLVRTCCDFDAGRLVSLSARFKAPAYPGETIRLEYWRDGGHVHFVARALERDVIVLSAGHAFIKTTEGTEHETK